MTFNKLGTIPNDAGGYSYEHEWNPLLIKQVYSNNSPWRFYPTLMNCVAFATPEAAGAIAGVLKGEVVPDPAFANFNLLKNGAPFPVSAVNAVKLPGGRIVNAGYICGVMGNDVAYDSAASKSEAICNEQLWTPVDYTLADRLYSALIKTV